MVARCGSIQGRLPVDDLKGAVAEFIADAVEGRQEAGEETFSMPSTGSWRSPFRAEIALDTEAAILFDASLAG